MISKRKKRAMRRMKIRKRRELDFHLTISKIFSRRSDSRTNWRRSKNVKLTHHSSGNSQMMFYRTLSKSKSMVKGSSSLRG